MQEYLLFIDASVNPQKKIGFAAFLFITKDELALDKGKLKEKIKLKEFDDTSSTKLEMQTLLWALNTMKASKLTIYTDCQNIITLLERREKLEKSNFHTKTGKLLNNHQFYKEFFAFLDKIECDFIKVKGHKKSSLKDDIDRVFNLVDKASRNALRELTS